MGTIEFYVNQDKGKLRKDVIKAYQEIREHACQCHSCKRRLNVFFEEWHPELYANYNDAFRIVSLLEQYGFPSYYSDSVLYTFELKVGEKTFSGDGIHLPQAICNLLLEFYKSDVWRKKPLD